MQFPSIHPSIPISHMIYTVIKSIFMPDMKYNPSSWLWGFPSMGYPPKVSKWGHPGGLFNQMTVPTRTMGQSSGSSFTPSSFTVYPPESELSQPIKKTHFGCSHPGFCSFGHWPKHMAAGDGWIKVWPVHQVFCLLAWLTLHHQSPLKHLQYSRYSNKKLTHITLHFLWLLSKILKLAWVTTDAWARGSNWLLSASQWDKPLDRDTDPSLPVLYWSPSHR